MRNYWRCNIHTVGSRSVLSRGFPLREYWMAVDFFAPVTLTLTRWPYTNWTRTPWKCTGCANMNFLCQSFPSYHTDIRTESTEIINHAASRVVKKHKMIEDMKSRPKSAENMTISSILTQIQTRPENTRTVNIMKVYHGPRLNLLILRLALTF